MTRRTSIELFVSVALSIMACGGADQPAQHPNTNNTVAPDDNIAGVGAPEATMPSNDLPSTMPTPVEAPAMSDAQIAAITDAANGGEVAQAKLALRRATDPRVKAFAQMMSDHHSDAKKKQQMLMSALNVAPEITPATTKLVSDSDTAIATLGSRHGKEFDVAYLDLQIKEHKEVLDTLDTKLIPSVHDASFKKSLVDFRPRVADHLKRAEDLRQILSKT